MIETIGCLNTILPVDCPHRSLSYSPSWLLPVLGPRECLRCGSSVVSGTLAGIETDAEPLPPLPLSLDSEVVEYGSNCLRLCDCCGGGADVASVSSIW